MLMCGKEKIGFKVHQIPIDTGLKLQCKKDSM